MPETKLFLGYEPIDWTVLDREEHAGGAGVAFPGHPQLLSHAAQAVPLRTGPIATGHPLHIETISACKFRLRLKFTTILLQHEMRFTIVGCALLGATVSGQTSAKCKTFPGDTTWPSKADWNTLNSTVGGRLIATVPLGAPCHGSNFNNATCNSLKEQWQYEKIQYVCPMVSGIQS